MGDGNNHTALVSFPTGVIPELYIFDNSSASCNTNFLSIGVIPGSLPCVSTQSGHIPTLPAMDRSVITAQFDTKMDHSYYIFVTSKDNLMTTIDHQVLVSCGLICPNAEYYYNDHRLPQLTLSQETINLVGENKVLANQNVDLLATEGVNLEGSFEVELGATFEAKAQDCFSVLPLLSNGAKSK